MKKFIFIGLCVFCFIHSFAQQIKNSDRKLLQQKEDSLKNYSQDIIQAIDPQNRFKADSLFTKMFVRALKTTNSFYYPFDSLQTISNLYPPDSSFRIFTWQMVINDNIIRQHGAIQMKTTDGSLKLFPLIDKSDITINIADTITDNKAWFGAVYYKIIQTKNGNQNLYTLLGYDENNIRSNRKIIEILSFKNEVPQFGGAYFNFAKDSVKMSAISRYILEYKKSAGVRLTYDVNLDMIVFDHLESESNEPKKKFTLVSDGDYEGFKWGNGNWDHIVKVFNQITPEGQEPVPSPIKDAKGNTIEDLLQDNTPMDKVPVETMPNTLKKVPKKKKA